MHQVLLPDNNRSLIIDLSFIGIAGLNNGYCRLHAAQKPGLLEIMQKLKTWADLSFFLLAVGRQGIGTQWT